MKRMRKAIALLVTLCMLLTLAAPAFAVSVNSAQTMPTVKNKDTQRLGNLLISEHADHKTHFGEGQVFTVSLPDGVEFDNDSTVDLVYVNGTVLDATYVKKSSKTLTITLPALTYGAADAAADVISVKFQNQAGTLKFNSFAGGDVEVTINGLDSAVTSGKVVIGRAISGETVTKALDVKTIGLDASNAVGGIIEISENAVMAMGTSAGEVTVYLTLPKGFEWATTDSTPNTIVTPMAGFSGAVVSKSTDGKERLQITFTKASRTQRGILQITPYINVKSDADLGEFKINVTGENVNDADVVVAKVADFGVKIKLDGDLKTIVSGRTDQALTKLEIEELVPGSLIQNRKVTITLPSWVDVQAVAGTVYSNGLVVGSPTVNADNGDNEISFTVTTGTQGTTNKGKMTIELRVAAKGDAEGDITAVISGNAGAKGEIVIGKAVKAAKGSVAEVKELKLAQASQAIGDITIKEGYKGAWASGTDIYVVLPTGFEWSGDPKKAEVVSGNVKITADSVKKTTYDGKSAIKIPVSTKSTTASEIKISGLQVSANITGYIGDVQAELQGNALVANYGTGSADGTFDVKRSDKFTVAKATMNEVVNPAAGVSKFGINSSIYYVGGAAKVMDAAPYIKEGRTYVPVRYLAYALGVSEDNIKYENGVVALTLGADVVTLTIGDKNLTVNGTVKAMDVAPEVTNGRTMLPARFVAEAFGAQVGYANGEVVIVK